MSPTTPDPDDERLAGALKASRVMQDAPEALVQHAIGLFQPRVRRAPRAGLPRLLAALRFDSGAASPLAFGRRSTATEQRQLLYTLEACDVDLRVAAAEGQEGFFVVSGQLLGPDSQGVVFAQQETTDPSAGTLHSAVLNEFGEFRLPPLAEGRWCLALEMADHTLELPPLQLPPAAPVR
jgi:hypothetical protein